MKRKLFLISMALFLINALTFAQQTTVKGTVTASDGLPLPGASVVLKGTTTGTVTDFDGIYTLSFEAGADAVLVYSFIGYTSQEVTLNGQTTIDIVLSQDISDLDEVVVVGYGVQKKSLVTGAISKISSDDLVATQPQRVEQAIQGKVSGVTVAAESGSPGAGVTIKIRGTGSNRNTDPLFIVDGMKTGGIDYLDPSDIESIEILKDAASAAIYGAEGGNGVVLITTKKGKKGMAQVSYSNYFGIQQYTNKLDILDADQYIDYYQKAMYYEGKYLKYAGRDEEFILGRVNSSLEKDGFPAIGEDYTGYKTNWLEEVTNVAPMQSHNLSISGGSEKSTYSSSVNYFNQEGITGGDKSQFKRLTARLNMEHQATDYLKVGIKATYSRRERNSLAENNEFGGIYGNAILIDPLTPTTYPHSDSIPSMYADVDGARERFAYKLDGKDTSFYGMSTKVRNEIINPLAQIENSNGTWGEDKIMAGAFVTITPIEGLNFKTSYDIDIANTQQHQWTPRYYYHNLNERDYSTAQQWQHNYKTWQFDNILSYSKAFGEHNMTAMVGTHAEEYNHNELTGWGRDLVRESWPFAHPASATNPPFEREMDITVRGNDTTVLYNEPVSASSAIGGSYEDPRRLASVFGRFSYNYLEKYMVNITMRSDKSSMLSTQKRPDSDRTFQQGFFPSFSLGWVLSKENFWTVPYVNFAKLRYSYGTNGNLSVVRPYEYVSVIDFAGYPYYDGIGTVIQGAAPRTVANPALTWETSIMHNLGLDFRILESKISGTIEYYKRITSDLIDYDIINGLAGSERPWANVGTVENSGIELELSYKQLEGDFQWEVGGNISYLKNEVTIFPLEATGANLGVGGPVTYIKEGHPIYSFYGYETDGLWRDMDDIIANNYIYDASGEVVLGDDGKPKTHQKGALPGDIKIIDTNGDGEITPDDRNIIGSPHPDVMLGLNFAAYYKDFDFSMNMTGAFGQEVYNGIYRNDIGYSNRPAHFLTDAWSPENPDADFYRPTISSAWNYAHNDQYLESGSYMKLRNVTLGYTLPKGISEKLQISKLRVYVAGNNLHTFTNYRGVDPEMGNTQDNVSSFGVDRGFYPQARQYLFGLNVTF